MESHAKTLPRVVSNGIALIYLLDGTNRVAHYGKINQFTAQTASEPQGTNLTAEILEDEHSAAGSSKISRRFKDSHHRIGGAIAVDVGSAKTIDGLG